MQSPPRKYRGGVKRPRRYNPRMPPLRPPLGGLSPQAFLRDYWQKRPLLVRQAVPGFAGFLDRRALFRLAADDSAEARLIERSPDWRVTHGPLARRALSTLPARDWTLLVNGINLHSRAADALLGRFAFVPWARLDDVMVSYAADGGGVGPHVDSYDVFLLQGPGRRRWRLAPPGKRPFRTLANAPLKLIAGFRPTLEMTLDPGDMLYLPPGWGHDGIALGSCQTYSIGFRAPGGAELSAAFLDFLNERGFADTAYTDPGRKRAAHPGRIDAHMVRHAARVLGGIRWDRATVGEFLGCYLSEPKQYVVFDPPRRPLGRGMFLRKLALARVRLDPRSRMLAHGTGIYLNGSAAAAPGRSFAVLGELADVREAAGDRLARGGAGELLYEWYLQGYLHLEPAR
jgi:50S ribosomal protein L16 3-hydroxylase